MVREWDREQVECRIEPDPTDLDLDTDLEAAERGDNDRLELTRLPDPDRGERERERERDFLSDTAGAALDFLFFLADDLAAVALVVLRLTGLTAGCSAASWSGVSLLAVFEAAASSSWTESAGAICVITGPVFGAFSVSSPVTPDAAVKALFNFCCCCWS